MGKLFANVQANKRAIWNRGWYPANRSTAVETSTVLVCVTGSSSTNTPPILPLLPMPPLPMVPTIPSLEAHPRNAASIVTKSGGESTSLHTIENNPVEYAPWIDIEIINFAQGLAGDFTIDTIQHFVQKEKVG